MKYKGHIESIIGFMSTYSESVSNKLSKFKELSIEALKAFKTGPRPELLYESLLKKNINKLQDISELCNIDNILGDVHSVFMNCFPINKMDTSKITADMENIYRELIESLNDVESYVRSKNDIILNNINEANSKLLLCPFGTKENRKKNANEFERCTVELFSWLFIGKIDLLITANSTENYSVVKRKLQRDAMFEINKNLNINPVIDFKFLHFILECKNFSKPNYTALLQAYAYMIFERMLLHDDNKTLCIIISRENPGNADITIRMRDRLCEINKNLMIIFMSVDDMNNMVIERNTNRNPAFVLIECIKSAKRLSKTSEYY